MAISTLSRCQGVFLYSLRSRFCLARAGRVGGLLRFPAIVDPDGHIDGTLGGVEHGGELSVRLRFSLSELLRGSAGRHIIFS